MNRLAPITVQLTVNFWLVCIVPYLCWCEDFNPSLRCDVEKFDEDQFDEFSFTHSWVLHLTVGGLLKEAQYEWELLDDRFGDGRCRVVFEEILSYEGESDEDKIGVWDTYQEIRYDSRPLPGSDKPAPPHLVLFLTKLGIASTASQLVGCEFLPVANISGVPLRRYFPLRVTTANLDRSMLTTGQPIVLSMDTMPHQLISRRCAISIYLDDWKPQSWQYLDKWPRNRIYPVETDPGFEKVFFVRMSAVADGSAILHIRGPPLEAGNHRLSVWISCQSGGPAADSGSGAGLTKFSTVIACRLNLHVVHEVHLGSWAVIKPGPPSNPVEMGLIGAQPHHSSSARTFWSCGLRNPDKFPLAPDIRLVYIVEDPVRTVANAFAAGETSVITMCERAGCLIPIAVEHLEASAGISEYAAHGVDFFLLEDHLHSWLGHTSGRYQIMFVKAEELAARLDEVANFVGDEAVRGLKGLGLGIGDDGSAWSVLDVDVVDKLHQMFDSFMALYDSLSSLNTLGPAGGIRQMNTASILRGELYFPDSVNFFEKTCLTCEKSEHPEIATLKNGNNGGEIRLKHTWTELLVHDWCIQNMNRSSGDYVHADSVEPWVRREQLERIHRNRTIIVSNANLEYVPLALNMWRAYRQLGVVNLLFVAEDCAAYEALVSVVGRDHVAQPLQRQQGLEAAQEYNTEGFRQLTFLRPLYLEQLLRMGFDILWQDVDTVPLADLQALIADSPADLVVADDSSTYETVQSPVEREDCEADVADTAQFAGGGRRLVAGEARYLCSCFIFMRAGRPRNLWMLARWRALLRLSMVHKNQPAFNHAMQDLLNHRIVPLGRNGTILAAVLPQRVLPNGQDFDRYRTTAAWAHANYRKGLATKVAFFRERGLWISDSNANT